MKPMGMTPIFQIVKPTRVQDAIYEAVSEAFDAGMTVDDFRREARECWEIHLRERHKNDMRDWERER